ncbi:MAG: FAD-dependent oxidoreductase [Rhodoferax sp.]|nr:FAD-dependent oxidoreductase [Rhodoferax sp.]
MKRRHFLGASVLPLVGCTPPHTVEGGFIGINHQRGHLLQGPVGPATPPVVRQTEVVIAGGGVAGLAAARALRLRGRDDFALLELEDSAGGNARGTEVGGMPCPMGAHYLPLPGDDAPHVQDLLEELGLRTRVSGRWQYDERHLCHSPQERLFFQGQWQEGLLPQSGVEPQTLAQYRQFAQLVEGARKAAHWAVPSFSRPVAPVQQALKAITFAAYLNQNGLSDAHLRWYLDYCCRDDYGAGTDVVSAWAGIHYFASRHGFHAPGMPNEEREEREGLLTWPEGNAWLTQRMAKPLGDRLHTAQVVLRIAQTRSGVEVDAWDVRAQRLVRWRARQAIVALPVFIAARVVQDAPDFLRQAAQRTVYAPWLVANIHIKAPLNDRPGAAPSWDNVMYGTAGLGYVDATHQSLQPVPGATVLTHYRALGGAPESLAARRRDLMAKPWEAWRDEILAEMALAHPDLPGKATRMDIVRYGHAMAIPVPEIQSKNGLQRAYSKRRELSKQEQSVVPTHGNLRFAHSDWAGYSVFEEAFTLGHLAGTTP